MPDLERVQRSLDEAKTARGDDFHRAYASALRWFRFVPRPDRTACAESFRASARASHPHEPAHAAYGTLLVAMDLFIAEALEQSLAALTDARAVFADAADRDGLGLTAMLIGAIYRTFGNHDQALKVLWEAQELLRQSGRYPIYLAANSNSIANIHLDAKQYDEALAMFRHTYDESTRADDYYFRVYSLHGLAKVLLAQGNAADAESALTGALRIAEENDSAVHRSTSLTELAEFRRARGDADDAYNLHRRALEIRERHAMVAGAITNRLRLADLELARRRPDAADALLAPALEAARTLKVDAKIAAVEEKLAQVAEARGDHGTALAHYKRFHALRETIARADSARALSDAKLIFEAERTREENATIRAQKDEIEHQNAQLKATIDELTRTRIGRKAKAWTLGIAIVLFIFQDAILGTVLRMISGSGYLISLAAKMAIIFSLAPVNRGIERHLLRRVAATPGTGAVR